MTGPEFHEFLIRGANDRLLTKRDDGEPLIGITSPTAISSTSSMRHTVARSRKASRRSAHTVDPERVLGLGTTRCSTERAGRPLELIAHVVENDLPYTEILTADYVMANPWAASGLRRGDDASTTPGDVHEFKPSQIE